MIYDVKLFNYCRIIVNNNIDSNMIIDVTITRTINLQVYIGAYMTSKSQYRPVNILMAFQVGFIMLES